MGVVLPFHCDSSAIDIDCDAVCKLTPERALASSYDNSMSIFCRLDTLRKEDRLLANA